MIKIRRNVFETNSSSTHSLVICTEDEYDKFYRGLLYYVDRSSLSKKFYTWEELIKLINEKTIYFDDEDYEELVKAKNSGDKETVEEILKNWEVYTFDSYWRDDLEDFEETYTLPSGETVHVFGQYGYDG